MTTKRLIYKDDKDILERIYKYEEEIFGDAAVGKYNIGPFTKYGRCYATYTDKDIISVIEVLFSPLGIAYLYGVSTNEKFRHRGYASKLYDFVIEDIKSLNVNSLELTVDPKNEKAIAFYKKEGFYIKDLHVNEYFDGDDRYIMRKDL